MHSPDCAIIQYASIDPATLKRPLECDGVECDGANEPPDVAAATDEAEQPWDIRPINAGPTATLTGDAARTFKAFQSAEVALRAAQKRRDDALRAFTEAVTR